jgi:hypothetical protein
MIVRFHVVTIVIAENPEVESKLIFTQMHRSYVARVLLPRPLLCRFFVRLRIFASGFHSETDWLSRYHRQEYLLFHDVWRFHAVVKVHR